MFEMTDALDMGREALLVSLLIAGPVLATGVLVGIAISLIQTVTQVQDQTFSIVPKIVAMFGALVFFLPWIGRRLIEYTEMMFAGSG
jgi:flagellar biosynthetic protein FliQ